MLKKLLFLLLLVSLPVMAAQRISDDCTMRGIRLWGKVRVVSNFADLHVRVVDNFADECGEWQFVDSHEDFTIQFVDFHEDFSIKYVDYFEGLP